MLKEVERNASSTNRVGQDDSDVADVVAAGEGGLEVGFVAPTLFLLMEKWGH
jgi:hypothetical protein